MIAWNSSVNINFWIYFNYNKKYQIVNRELHSRTKLSQLQGAIQSLIFRSIIILTAISTPPFVNSFWKDISTPS